jgi:hypothetical protein
VTFVTATVFGSAYSKGEISKTQTSKLRKDDLNMMNSSNETCELTAGELDAVAAGVKIGPISIEWSKGCGCVDIGFAGLGGFYIGAGGAGASWGSHYIKLF